MLTKSVDWYKVEDWAVEHYADLKDVEDEEAVEKWIQDHEAEIIEDYQDWHTDDGCSLCDGCTRYVCEGNCTDTEYGKLEFGCDYLDDIYFDGQDWVCDHGYED